MTLSKLTVYLVFLSSFSLVTSSNLWAESKLCMENICIGDDVESLDVKWVPVDLNYKTKRAVDAQLTEKNVDEIYLEFNELLIADESTRKKLIPHIIQLQKFDNEVLGLLANKVKAICTPLSLTGEVNREGETKLFVTFRTIADQGGRGKLRVVQLEKEFNIYPPHVRPADKEKYVAMVKVLRQDYPNLVQVRDIDARASTNEIAFADAILGYRFFSDVVNPLIFRLKDLEDIESIEFDPTKSSLCPQE